MLIMVLALFIGWLWTFVHLDSLFANLLHFTITQYYLTWFFIGVIIWINRIFKR